MTQEYTPVSWQDETTSQQGTLINAERLNQMQTAHHYADGLEETDTVPTADPGVAYHKIVYCTADSTIYRWDGTQWTADIDDPTRELLEEHLADHDNPHQVTKAQVGLGNCNNTSDADKPISTATQTALDTKLTQRFTTAVGRQYVYAYTRTQQTSIEASQGMETLTIPIRDSEGAMHAQVPASPQATHVINYGWANTELDKKADKATTYTKAETDTLLGGKADKATTLAGYGITDAYTKTEADTLLGAKVDKLTTSGESAYTHNGSTQGERAISYDVVAGSIPRRDASGYLQANTNSTGVKSNILATGTRVQNDLDAYAPMVRTTGNQTIAGVKTFSSSIIQSGSASPTIKPGNDPKTTVPATNLSHNMVLIQDDSSNNINGMFSTTGTDGKRTISLYSFDCDGTYRAVRFLNPTAYTPGNTTDVATIGTLDAYTPMVRTSGNQSISGTKIFSGDVGITGAFNNKCKYYGYVSAAANYEKIATLTPGTLGGAFVGMIYSTKGQTSEFKNRHGIFYARVRNTDLQIIWMMKGSSIVEKQLYLTYDGSKFELWGLVNYDAANEAMGFNLISESNAGTIPYNLVTINTDDIVKTEAELSQYQLSSYSQ